MTFVLKVLYIRFFSPFVEFEGDSFFPPRTSEGPPTPHASPLPNSAAPPFIAFAFEGFPPSPSPLIPDVFRASFFLPHFAHRLKKFRQGLRAPRMVAPSVNDAPFPATRSPRRDAVSDLALSREHARPDVSHRPVVVRPYGR